MTPNKITIEGNEFELEELQNVILTKGNPIAYFEGKRYIGKAIPKEPEKDYEIVTFKSQWSSHVYDATDLETITHDYPIHSVKRLSDGEVFTVGQKVKSTWKEQVITGFDATSNNLIVDFETCRNPLSEISKIKERTPLFTTEDGKEIFDGDNFFSVDLLFNVHKNYKSWDTKHFSSQEKANEYVLMNKKVFSVKDIHNHFDTWAYPPNDYVRNKIVDLAKQLNK